MSAQAKELLAAGRYPEAETLLRRALAEQAGDAALHELLGVCLYFQQRVAESIPPYESALKLQAGRPTTWFNLGTSLSEVGRYTEAVAAYRQCLAREPANESAKYNLSRALLLLGQWNEGWQLYEARGRKKNPLHATLKFERWRGEPPGRYVLALSTEQGLGDAIQFVRFAPHLRRAGYEVLVLTAPPLPELFKCVAGIGPVSGNSSVRVDGLPVKWAPLMSVPAALRLTPGTIPNAPYLGAEPQRAARWRERIGGHGFKIGIVWQGNPGHANDKRRSLRLGELAPLAKIPNVRLISLQKQPAVDDAGDDPLRERVEIFADPADTSPQSLLDTAAIMTLLDLVITVDTMPAHLAGALGRPVWLALDTLPDWRWQLERTDTPWYPSMRLYRQPAPGDWQSVIAAMAAALSRA